jgi:hypothetical protein
VNPVREILISIICLRSLQVFRVCGWWLGSSCATYCNCPRLKLRLTYGYSRFIGAGESDIRWNCSTYHRSQVRRLDARGNAVQGVCNTTDKSHILQQFQTSRTPAMQFDAGCRITSTPNPNVRNSRPRVLESLETLKRTASKPLESGVCTSDPSNTESILPYSLPRARNMLNRVASDQTVSQTPVKSSDEDSVQVLARLHILLRASHQSSSPPFHFFQCHIFIVSRCCLKQISPIARFAQPFAFAIMLLC